MADVIVGKATKDKLVVAEDRTQVYGLAGSDTLISEGKDIIYDWESGDMLKILNADGSAGAYTNSSFKSGKLTLAIAGGGHVIFSGVSASDSFNINGTVHSIVGKKLK